MIPSTTLARWNTHGLRRLLERCPYKHSLPRGGLSGQRQNEREGYGEWLLVARTESSADGLQATDVYRISEYQQTPDKMNNREALKVTVEPRGRLLQGRFRVP